MVSKEKVLFASLPKEIKQLEKKIELSFFTPSDTLSVFIQTYWHLKPTNNKFLSQKIVTDGGSGIIFNFDTSCENAILLTCPRLKALHFPITNTTDIIGIRFLPGGAYPFLKKFTQCKNGNTINLSNQDISQIEQIYESMKNAKTIQERINILNNFFLKQLQDFERVPSLWIFEVIDTMKSHEGNLKINELSKKLSLSMRQFERLFKKEVGLSPKQFSKILRMQKARSLISSKNFDSLTDISYESNYFDQAHFIKDFKVFVEETPKEYFIRKQ